MIPDRSHLRGLHAGEASRKIPASQQIRLCPRYKGCNKAAILRVYRLKRAACADHAQSNENRHKFLFRAAKISNGAKDWADKCS